ncbi:NOTC3-like protein [Mya arenaria]|uniref:NOTC3-like protein n=1 Tax=Mya arenaria TaxID=6604 RepID=A0ABY7FMA1_MYAAR|nr:NOTC3-like protein [Mya arenaria]
MTMDNAKMKMNAARPLHVPSNATTPPAASSAAVILVSNLYKPLNAENWQGGQCNDDVDECSFMENVCAEKSNSSCINSVGSFTCSCDAGYTDKNGACEECSGNTYGAECNQNCNCTFANTQSDEQSCDRETGTCICNSFWTGDRCETDVNECTTSVGERTTVPTAANEVRIDLTIILEVELDPGTDLGVQTVFDEIAAKVKYSIRKHFSKFISIEITIVINDMSRGSINVNYSIIYAKNSQVALRVSQALEDIASGTEIEYDGLKVSASAPESYTNDSLCGLYEKALGGCEYGYECEIEGSEPMCKLLPTSDNYPVVVGVTAGLSVFCVAVLIIITSVVVYKRNRKARSSNLHRRGESETSADEHMNVWPPWKEGIATDPSFNSWRTKALNFGQEHRYVSPYHLPRFASSRTREEPQEPYLAHLGSINVNYSIIYAKSHQVALGVSQALVDIAAGTEIEYDGLNVSASAPDNYAVVVGVTLGLSVFCIAVLIIITSVVVYNRNRMADSSNFNRRRESAASADKQSNIWPPWQEEIGVEDGNVRLRHLFTDKKETAADPGIQELC